MLDEADLAQIWRLGRQRREGDGDGAFVYFHTSLAIAANSTANVASWCGELMQQASHRGAFDIVDSECGDLQDRQSASERRVQANTYALIGGVCFGTDAERQISLGMDLLSGSGQEPVPNHRCRVSTLGLRKAETRC